MNSEFLQLLITQTWQIATLTIVVAIVSRLAAKNRPHLAHALWMLVLIKCVTPPLWGHSLGVFSQLQATFALDESTATDIDPETDTIMIDAPDIALSVAKIESTSAEDRSLEFFEHDELDAALEFEAQSKVGSLKYNDIASAYDETPAAIAAPNVDSKDLTADYAHYKSVLIAAIFTGAILTLLIMIFRFLRCLRQIHRQRTTEFDEPLNHRIQQLAKQLRIRRAPRIIVSNLLFGPAVLGFLRHTIVLPRCLFESLEGANSDVVPSRLGTGEKVADRPDEGFDREPSAIDAQLHFLDPILAHELLHIRRGDLRTGTLQAIVASLWWFHPAVWFSNRLLSREAERCCDEQVIAELGCTPGQYARALLSVIECKHRLQPIPVFPGMKPVEITTQRLERIMSLKNGLKKRTPLWCWLMIAMLAFVVLPGAVAQPRDDESAPVAASTAEGPESEQTIENTKTVSKHKAQVAYRIFEGNSFWWNGDLRKKLASEKSFWNLLGEVFSPDAIPADVEALKGYYRSVGFFDVEVTGRPLFSRDRSDVNLHFTVTEGRRYKVREIRYEGNNRIASSDLQEGTVLNSGDYYDAAKVAEDVRRIRDRYAREGHKTPAINPVPKFNEEMGILNLVFEIDEESTANTSTKNYAVHDLMKRLAVEHGLSADDARKSLIDIFEKAAPPVMEMPQGFPALPKVAASQSAPASPAPRQLSSILFDGDQLTVVQSDIGHKKLKEEMDRFRKFGFKRFQVRACFIMGSAEEINTMLSSLKMAAPFSNTKKTPVAEIQHKPANVANPEKPAITNYQMGLMDIVSRDEARAIEELARSKSDCLTVESPQVHAFNGQTAMTHVGETKPYIVGFRENDEPMIRTVINGLTLHVTPTTVDDGQLRLQCVSGIESVSEIQDVSILRRDSEAPQRIQLPAITSKRVQTTVELRDDQTLLLTGLTTPQDGKSQAVLAVLDAVPVSLKALTVSIHVGAGQEEVVVTENPQEQPIAETAAPGSLRVPAFPLPEWISKSSDPLVKLIWDAREASQRRLLMTDQRIPWLFKHGLAALRREFLIRDGDEAVVGLDWLQNGPEIQLDRFHNTYRGPWFRKTEYGGQPDPRSVEFAFDENAQEFVATLAINEMPIDATFKTADGTITMNDLVKHLQMTVSEKKLTPWTLCALSKYLSRNETWTNAKGEQWSIDRLVAIELNKSKHLRAPLSLMSLAIARNHFFQTGESLDGNWLEADRQIREAIDKSRPSTTSEGKIVTTSRLRFRSPQFQYGSQFVARTYPAAFTHDTALTNSAQMLLFLTIALPNDRLREDWFRLAIESAANDLVMDWSKADIRSPFYETTQAMTVYLQRIAAVGISARVEHGKSIQVQVTGQIAKPGSYVGTASEGMRVLDAIALAGGTQDTSADSVSVIRNVGRQQQPTVLQMSLKRAKRGADPNFFLANGDVVLLHTAELVKKPLASSIRLDDNFALSADTPISGSTVIAFVNGSPITVKKFIGSGWDTLERVSGLSDTGRRRIVCESIISGLPEFVFQELILQHFNVALPELNGKLSPQQRETADRNFTEAFEKLPRRSDSRQQSQIMAAILAEESASNTAARQKHVDAYVRGLQSSTVASNKSSVITHVQELVTTARLRGVVSLEYTNADLAEVIQSVEEVHGIDIKVNSLHEQISQRILDGPAAVDFHAVNKPLGDSLTVIIEPFGLALHLEGDDVLLQFADSQRAMEKFRTLPGPPSFGVFGVLKNPGWHSLNQEIRLLDALAIAGGVANSEGVSIELTNLDIIDGKANPVSMSLHVLQNDPSGKLNRIVKDGDMIRVTRHGSKDAPLVERTDVLMFGKGVTDDSKLATDTETEFKYSTMPLGLRIAQTTVQNYELRRRKIQEILAATDEASTGTVTKLKSELMSLELQIKASRQLLQPSDSLKSPYRAASSDTDAEASESESRSTLAGHPVANVEEQRPVQQADPNSDGVVPVAYHKIGVTPLTGSSVVATVNGKPVFVDDILGGVRRKIEADPNLKDEQRQMILLQSLRARTREYTEDELVVQALEATIPEDKRKLICDSLEPAFQEVCQKMMKDRKLTTDDELDQWLEDQGFTRREMKDTFFRRQFVVGYVQSKLQVPAQIDRAVLVKYYQEHIDEYTRVEVSQVINAPHPTTVEFEAVQEEIQNKLLGQLREDARKQVLAEICAKGHVITIFDGEEPTE